MRRAHQLRSALQMARATEFVLRLLGKKWSSVAYLGELMAVGGLFHERVAIHAHDAPARMRARFPVGLKSPLMTAKTGFVLLFGRLTRIFAKSDHAADALASARSDVIASRPVATFASSFLRLVARVMEKNFSHHGSGKFFKGGSVTGLANFVADVSGGARFGRLLLRCQRQSRMSEQ